MRSHDLISLKLLRARILCGQTFITITTGAVEEALTIQDRDIEKKGQRSYVSLSNNSDCLRFSLLTVGEVGAKDYTVAKYIRYATTFREDEIYISQEQCGIRIPLLMLALNERWTKEKIVDSLTDSLIHSLFDYHHRHCRHHPRHRREQRRVEGTLVRN